MFGWRGAGWSLMLLSCARFGEAEAEPKPDGGGVVDAASGTDGSTDAPTTTCAVDTCEGRGPSCRTYDFSGPTCPPDDWTTSGNVGNAGVTRECTAAGLHLAARDTLDMTAELEMDLPATLATARVSLRFSATKWDGKRVFRVGTGGLTRFVITGQETARGELDLELCIADAQSQGIDCTPLALTSFGAEHILSMELGASGAIAQVDCGPTATRSGRAVEGGGNFTIAFGHPDGNPFDGTLHALTLSFR